MGGRFAADRPAFKVGCRGRFPEDPMRNAFFTASLADADPAIAYAIAEELGREQDQIELIASENIVSLAVLQAQGSLLTNKYAEGYPGKRYYGGCEVGGVGEQ